MARSFGAKPGGRSRQAAGAEAQDPWEDAAAALRSRRSSTPSEPWGTGTRASTEVPITDTWGTGPSTEAPVTDTWGTGASREAPVMETWGPRASREAPVMETWGPRAIAPVTVGWGIRASMDAPVTNPWGTRTPTDAPVTWGAMPSTGAPVIHGWGMPSTDAPVTCAWGWGVRASEASCIPWGHGPLGAGDTRGRSAPERSRFTVPPPPESEVVMNITASNAKAFLHCGVCTLPLKPPIFQCDAGHAVCSPCRDELLGRGTRRTCDVCGGRGYRRSRLMEGLVESLRVACPNAARGCDATPAYRDLHAHRTGCAHAPGTRCPVRGCGVVAPMAELLDHFTDVHGWPVTTQERVGKSFHVVLRDGFNVVATAVRNGGSQQHLLLLNVSRQPFALHHVPRRSVGRTVSAVCIHPPPAVVESWVAKTVELELRFWAARHYQESEFNVPFVDLADGLPNDLAQFVVPSSVHPDDDDTLLVTAFLTIK